MKALTTISNGELYRSAGPIDRSKAWKGINDLLRVTNIVDETADVKTFTFEATSSACFDYRAGQYITLDLQTASGSLLKTYTISSTPSRPMTISVTAKAQLGSIGTRWMFENLIPGSLVKAIGPAGQFTLERATRQSLLFISAGSGITPMMSMLRWLSDVYPSADVAFIYCARSPSDIIFRDEISLMCRSMPNLSVNIVVQERARADAWTGVTGLLDTSKLFSFVPSFRDREIYCCGPEPFMNHVRGMVLSNGASEIHFHQEAFTFAAAETAKQDVGLPGKNSAENSAGCDKDAGKLDGHAVRFGLSSIEHFVEQDETVLQVAKRAGVSILSVCEMGLCGTCKVMKTAGSVVMDHNGGITDEEIEEGYILACCSKPSTDVEIEA